MFDGNTLSNIEMSQHNGMNSSKVIAIASVIFGRPLPSSINSVDSHCHCSLACRAQDGQGSYMEVQATIQHSTINKILRHLKRFTAGQS